jgi:hypothetical protein
MGNPMADSADSVRTKRRTTSLHAGCLECSAAWPPDQLVHRQADGRWVAICIHCGTRQDWSWVRR